MRTAVVLLNLGGPDSLHAVKPFLFNLFNDPAILRVPSLIRYCLARLISNRRAPESQHIYRAIGGASPLLANTVAQAKALDDALGEGYKTFVAMRYWHPLTHETIEAVRQYSPDKIILLPLYPQFSTSTTASSQLLWETESLKAGLPKADSSLCCYPTFDPFITSIQATLNPLLDRLANHPTRVLFSAHGVPEKFIRGGDPYQLQVEATVQAIIKRMPANSHHEYITCYQSRVGPVKWITPYTDDEIKRAGQDGYRIILAPISFVSEHSETLYELDQEYWQLAHTYNVPAYYRLPTLGVTDTFISSLAQLIKTQQNGFICPKSVIVCPKRKKCNS